jgi:4-alpha-glucanotransferase
MQDVLGLGEDARMNTPGRESGNWGWRMTAADFNSPAQARLAALTELYGRAPVDTQPEDDENEA